MTAPVLSSEQVAAMYHDADNWDVVKLADSHEALRARIEELERERDAWQETGRQHLRDAEFYRSLVTEIGMRFGVAARTADDGSIMDSVLALKVNGLVGERIAALTAQLAAAREAVKVVEAHHHFFDDVGSYHIEISHGGTVAFRELLAALAAMEKETP